MSRARKILHGIATVVVLGCGSEPVASDATVASSAPPAAPAVDVAKINAPFRDLKDVPSWTAKFERESREIYAQRLAIVDALHLEPGMHVADLGAGTGLFEPCLSLLVGPAGRVYALDIAPLFVEHVRLRALAESLPNVESLPCTDDATGLPDACVDLVFVCDVYHHFEHPERNLASIHRTLKPGGRLIVVDFEKEPGQASEFVLGHVRAGKATVLAEITAAGFELEREEPFLQENYFLAFRRRD